MDRLTDKAAYRDVWMHLKVGYEVALNLSLVFASIFVVAVVIVFIYFLLHPLKKL